MKIWLNKNTYTDLESFWNGFRIMLYVRYLSWKHNIPVENLHRSLSWKKKTGQLD